MRLPTRREWGLLALGAAVVLAAAYAERGDVAGTVDLAEATQTHKPKAERTRIALADELDVATLRREPEDKEAGNLFASKSWYVAPPPQPPAAVAPAPPPSAPPLPFTYLGRLDDPAKPVFFLVAGDRVLFVSKGDVIENTYRVEGITGSALTLTYLPLNIRQSLDVGRSG